MLVAGLPFPLRGDFPLRSLSDIAGICVSSVCGSFIPVDGEGRQTHNAILYGIDRRAVKQAEELNEKYGPELAARLGGSFTTHSVFPKILWLREHCPEVFAESAYFLEPNNFVTYRLTGKQAWDYPSAAGTTLVDRPALEWPRDLFAAEGVDPDRFPLSAGLFPSWEGQQPVRPGKPDSPKAFPWRSGPVTSTRRRQRPRPFSRETAWWSSAPR